MNQSRFYSAWILLTVVLLPGCTRATDDTGASPTSPLEIVRQAQLPFAKPAAMSGEVWLKSWADQLPVSASIRVTENSMHPNQYPVYSARITITNNTGHRLATGTNLYVVQTAERNSPTESTSALLRVIGGQFKQPPLEDYSGVVEFRGSEHNEYESLGLVDWVSVETRGGLYDFMGVFLHVAGYRSRYPAAQDFGGAAPGRSLRIDTSDLQLSIAVKQDRLASTYMVSPELRFGTNQEARFRYLLRFAKGSHKLEEAALLPIAADALVRVIVDKSKPLWMRVFATRWAGTHFAPSVAQALQSALQDDQLAVRAAALEAIGAAKHRESFEPVLQAASDDKGHARVRRAAVRAVGQLGDTRATPLLTSLVTAKDSPFRLAGLQAMAAIADPGGRETVMKLLEAGQLPSADLAAPFVDETMLDRLLRVAGNPKVERGAAIGAIAKVGTPAAFAALLELQPRLDARGRAQLAAALRGIDEPAALAILRTAVVDQDKSVQYNALQSLATVKSAERAQILLEKASGSTAEGSRSALQIAAKSRIAEVKPRLLVVVKDAGLAADLRRSAAQALAYFPGPDSIETLTLALQDSSKDLRMEAAQTLAVIGGAAQIPALTKVLSDSEMLVRLYAARSISDLGSDSSCGPLVDAFVRESSGEAGVALSDGLLRLGCVDKKQAAPLIARLRVDVSDKRLRGAIGQYLSAASGQKFDTGYGASGNAVDAAQATWANWAGVGK